MRLILSYAFQSILFLIGIHFEFPYLIREIQCTLS